MYGPGHFWWTHPYRFYGKCHSLTVLQEFFWKPQRKKSLSSAILSCFSLVTVVESIWKNQNYEYSVCSSQEKVNWTVECLWAIFRRFLKFSRGFPVFSFGLWSEYRLIKSIRRVSDHLSIKDFIAAHLKNTKIGSTTTLRAGLPFY